MRYEKVTLVHVAAVPVLYAVGMNAYQYVTGAHDYVSTIVPTIVIAAISVTPYVLARLLPFGRKTKDSKAQRPAPQPSPMKPQH
jgi:hypothetical protein